MVVRPVIYDGSLQRAVAPGDVLAGGELLNALTTAGSGTITAALMLGGIINRTGPGAGYADVFDSPANLIAAMVGNYNYQASLTAGLAGGAAIQPGTTFRVKFINTVAFANTIGATTGVTLTLPNVAASSVKDWLVTITNGSPQQVFAVSQVNASAVITGLSQFQTSLLSVGMLVTGTNIPGGATVISIQNGVGVTLSAAATATLTNNALTFSPSYTVQGIGQGLL